MSQKAILRALVSALALAGVVQATEVRSPLLSERGPLRYIFTKEKAPEDKLAISVYSAGYGRQADKAYIKHGFATKELSAVYFGKSDFRLGEILPNASMQKSAEFYNPLVSVLKISPRASYTEKGMVVGTRIAYPLSDSRGTIGLRASVPFRQIDIVRNDQGDRDSEQLQDLVVKVNRKFSITAPQTVAYAWRADLVNALIMNMDKREPVLSTDVNLGVLGMYIGANQIAKGAGVAIGGGILDGKKGIIASPEGFIPRRNVGVVTADITGGTISPTALLALSPSDQQAYVLDQTANYATFNTNVITDAAARLAVTNEQANIWFTTGHTAATGVDTDAQSTAAINNALALGFGGENTYEWLADRGWSFETARQVGIGDADLDFFYEYQINDEVNSELFLGVRLPTGGNADYLSNPYRGRLGNTGHWELKLGGMLAYELADWANVKADAYYSFVLSRVEPRTAMFTGAQVRNIGPRADATVDWGYFVGRLDFTLFHPKTNALSSVFGYEFYLKGKDNVKFKQSQIASWMGRKWTDANGVEAGTPAAAGSPTVVAGNAIGSPTIGTKYSENLFALDNAAAAQNTDSIAHKVRFETSYRFSDWFECFCGGAYTFAGQNSPRETDMHCGMNVRY